MFCEKSWKAHFLELAPKVSKIQVLEFINTYNVGRKQWWFWLPKSDLTFNLIMHCSHIFLCQAEWCPGERLWGGRGWQDHVTSVLSWIRLPKSWHPQWPRHPAGPGSFQAAGPPLAQRDPVWWEEGQSVSPFPLMCQHAPGFPVIMKRCAWFRSARVSGSLHPRSGPPGLVRSVF